MPWDGSLFGYAPSPVPQGGPVMPSPTPVPPPTPGATSPPPGGGVPTPGSGAGGQTPQQLAEFIAQLLHGGQGGGNNPAPGSAFGGNAGSANGMPVGPGGGDYFTMPNWLDHATNLATLAPFPYGTIASLARAGGRAYNMYGVTNPNRESLGIPDLSFMQGLGGFFGSPYGNFQNPQVANAEQTAGSIPPGWGNTAITANGGPVPGWMGLFGGGGPSMSYANDQPGLPGSSALDQHQIVLAQQQAANGTLPMFSNGGVPPGYVQFQGRISDLPANAVEVNGFHYVPGGGGNGGGDGAIYDGRTSYNTNDRSSQNTNPAGQPSNATGAYGQRGIGAGTY